MEHYVREYTVSEFIRDGTEPMDKGHQYEGETYWQPNETDTEFLGFTKPVDAAKAANFGWSKGAELIAKLRTDISRRLGIRNRQLTTCSAMVGGMVDVPAYLQGLPDCMVAFEETEQGQPGFVHVHLSAGVSATVSTKIIQLQGAIIGALVDALESCNHRVRLTWERSSKGEDVRGNEKMITLWLTLKEYDEPLDLDRLSFFLCNNAARRGMAWTAYMRAPKAFYKALQVEPGNAHCWPCSHPDLFANADVQGRHIDVREDRAAEWILKEMERLGVTVDQGA